jgi:DNA polymerase (family 10)
MTVHNADVASVFNRLADLLEIDGANPFRVRAYRRAAATIEDLPESAAGIVASGRKLSELPGIGEDLAGKIKEILATGRCKTLDEVERHTPSTLAALTSIPGLGPKRVHTLHQALGITSLQELAEAAKPGKLRELPRFSEAMEAKILAELEEHRHAEQRFKISTAEDFRQRHLRLSPELEWRRTGRGAPLSSSIAALVIAGHPSSMRLIESGSA